MLKKSAIKVKEKKEKVKKEKKKKNNPDEWKIEIKSDTFKKLSNTDGKNDKPDPTPQPATAPPHYSADLTHVRPNPELDTRDRANTDQGLAAPPRVSSVSIKQRISQYELPPVSPQTSPSK